MKILSVSKTNPWRPQFEALFSTVVTVPVKSKIRKKVSRTKHFNSLPISEQNEFKVLELPQLKYLLYQSKIASSYKDMKLSYNSPLLPECYTRKAEHLNFK